ncbi:hypothetical protein C1646_713192 [Rhizophagus diaphanus]|nr:hypothetical protein C1646_713192 [Rhizophagus diaphanus] [Rhizophagus sp. MUCL 43196]
MLKIKVNSNFYYNLIKKYTFDTCSLLFYKIVPRLYGVDVSISYSPKKIIITWLLPKFHSKFPPPRVTIMIKDIVLNIKISLNIR